MDTPQGPHRQPVAEGLVFEREVGSGGSGRVYVARDAAGRTVAVKLAADGDAAADQVAREVEVLGRLRHRHLVEVHGAVETEDGPAVVMEYLPGGSVADVVGVRGPVGLGEAVTVLAPVAEALAYLHGAGAVHGDVAPGNVLFTAEGMPKLGDLGLAAVLGLAGSSGGTPGFTAPEAADPAEGPVLRPARDVYAVGALAWFLLTGRTPAPTRHRPPLGSLLPSVPDDFAELVEACLSEDPGTRPPASEVAKLVFCGGTPEPVELTESVHPEALGQLVTRLSDERKRGGWFRRWLPAKAPWRRGTAHRGAGAARAARTSPRRARASGALVSRRAAVVLAAGVLLAGGSWWAVGHGAGGSPSNGTAPAPSKGTAPPSKGTAPAPSIGSAPPSNPAVDDPADRTGSPGPVAGDRATPAGAAVVLAQRRDAALSQADADALAHVHHPQGTSLVADRDVVAELRAAGRRFAGLRTVLEDIHVLPGATEDAATVVAVSRIGPYRVTTLEGGTVSETAGTTVQRLRLELGRGSDGQWLIRRVLEAAPAA